MKTCKVHGELDESQCLIEKTKKGRGFIRRCKQCRVQTSTRKSLLCKKHGALTIELITTQGRCRICHKESANKKRDSNRAAFNKKISEDKAKNPEKWKRYYKEQYQAKKLKYGELFSIQKVCSARGITVDHYFEMLEKQNGKCAICIKPESCIDGVSKNIRRLSIDHCHKTGKVRGLLCHRCNTAIGKFDEDVIVMKNAIKYLKYNNQDSI